MKCLKHKHHAVHLTTRSPIMINALLHSLSQRESSSTVFNQYQQQDIRNNLRLYLTYLLQQKSKVLLIGEAPGYKGCRLTGIPFTSGAIIESSKHEIFKEIRDKIKLSRPAVSENTATIVWRCLEEYKDIPILWNAFPFHPHKKDEPKSNRKPTKEEIEEGKDCLRIVHKLFKPKKFCSIGRVGEKILANVFPDKEISYIRHPSYGGKNEFKQGIARVLK